jgi:uncharacterized protein
MNDFYVYVYIDPRNLEEFYFGKGKGSRKDAHLTDSSDSDKARRIAAIKQAGLTPIIKVIARNLSEHDALLVEKTLLWKLGRNLTNVASGHYADSFRPHDTIHLDLHGFDFQTGIYYYNVGEGPHRCWLDYMRFGFISAGQGSGYGKAMQGFQVGDVVAAYLKRNRQGGGFVGIGRVTARAQPIRNVKISGRPLLRQALECKGMSDNVESDDLCEYVAFVDWKATVPRLEGKWRTSPKLYTTRLIRASLSAQPATVKFLETSFGVNLRELLR